ncbi:MAG: hypothetical protein N0A16_10375 [Blastocatellia bacterium]|nr:hypothetical protein [Blastocatellia bacterium]MCS7158121.1 hypothetical protein [Blastocatellia bacterium]MDW8168539.1 hypothetical protein [Acidobacteriota bacterium]MDW8256953.1 hypothetical protein [Acidobacteriota bacterium]
MWERALRAALALGLGAAMVLGAPIARTWSTTSSAPQAFEKAPQRGLRWWGRVDGRDILCIRRGTVWVIHEEGEPIVDTDFRLERPLPAEPVTVSVRKIRGRGRVEVLEQPSRENNFTARILIEDKKSGSDRYEIEVFW